MKPTIAFALLLLAGAASAAPELVSPRSGGGGTGNATSERPRLSANGRYVIFESIASDLIAGVTDTNADFDVFRRDLTTNTTVLVSRAAAGAASGNGVSYTKFASADGNFIAFTSEATNLVAGADTNGQGDVFLRDVAAGTTRRVSNNLAGSDSANGYSEALAISADGRFVVFASTASNLASVPDTNNDYDLFLFDRLAGTVQLISVNRQGAAAGKINSANAVGITPDGRYVVFVSLASDLVVETDANGVEDVFVRDTSAGTTRLVSAAGAGGVTSNGVSAIGSRCISADGRYIAYQSFATNVIASDTTPLSDIYLRDMVTGATTLVSVDTDGTGPGNSGSDSVQLSANARYVAFASTAGNLVSATSNGHIQLFVRDLQTHVTQLVSRTPAGNVGNADSIDIRMAESGQAAAFISLATDLAGGSDTSSSADIFLWQAPSRVTRLSNNAAGNAGNGDSNDPDIAPDGLVVFQTFATDFGSADVNNDNDVYIVRSSVFANGFE